MSLHAQLPPQTIQLLRQQKRKSTLTSLLISIFTIFLVSIALTFFLVKGQSITNEELTVIPQIHQSKDPHSLPATVSPSTRKPSPPANQFSVSLLALPTENHLQIPAPEFINEIPSGNLGTSENKVDSSWISIAGSSDPEILPTEQRKRCSKADRLARLKSQGGSEASEEAVLESLRWLQKNQNPDGSWGSGKPVAMTGLSLLAYLGHCETPTSPEFGNTVTEGMLYLVNSSLQQNGKLASNLRDKHWCYEHAIATYALAESYLFCRSQNLTALTLQLAEVLQSGTEWILNHQTKAGGWDYHYATDNRPGDTSIVAWQLQALKAASQSNLPFPKIDRAISRGLSFLKDCQHQSGGFGYRLNKRPVGSANNHFTLTGAGSLCFQQHKGVQNKTARKGIHYLTQNTHFNFAAREHNLYEHYYASQAFINHGGKEWSDYNQHVLTQVLQNQQPDGSWPHSTGPGAHSHPVYATALATLMLEVYYRYLPGTVSSQ